VQSPRSRELVFTTLIDLLVQIVFILTIVLIVIPLRAHEPEPRKDPAGDGDADPWQTLVALLRGDKSAADIKRKDIVADVSAMKKDLEEQRRLVASRDSELKDLKKKVQLKQGEGAAPGLERCTVNERRGRPAFKIAFGVDNKYRVRSVAGSEELARTGAFNLDPLLQREWTWSELRPKLEPLWQYGKARECTYVVDWEHAPGTDGDAVLSARGNLEQMFYLTRPISRQP
jgi:hypothetical protein